MTALPLLARYPSAGDVIDGKYRVLAMLGEGGMGAVARCEHLLRRVPVALKFMAPHVMAMEGGVERFLNEAVLASQIPTDHVVAVLDVGKLPSGAPYLVMEYLEGHDLDTLLEQSGGKGIAVPRAIHIVLQILRALQVAHAVGIVHRDLKPANVFLVEKDGEKDFVKLLDFGISKAPVSAGITHTNMALGTPLYMSPEQARNPKDVDNRADLYSTGVILYELLTGRTPHLCESGEATELILKLFTENPPEIASLRPDLPRALCEAVHKSLARERSDRFEDARAMAEALAPFADERSASVIAKIRAFSGAEKLASPVSATDAFERLGAQAGAPAQSTAPPPLAPTSALAATQAVVSAQAAADSRVPPARIPWVPIAGILTVGFVIAITVYLNHRGVPVANLPPAATPSAGPAPPVSSPAPSPVTSSVPSVTPSSSVTTPVTTQVTSAAPPPPVTTQVKSVPAPTHVTTSTTPQTTAAASTSTRQLGQKPIQ